MGHPPALPLSPHSVACVSFLVPPFLLHACPLPIAPRGRPLWAPASLGPALPFVSHARRPASLLLSPLPLELGSQDSLTARPVPGSS